MHFFLRLLLPLLVAFAVVAEDETECVDLDNRCGDWESMGECVRNSDIRLTQCRRSCGVCGNGGNNDGNMNVNDDDEDDNDLPEDIYMARGADMGKAQILVRQDGNDARPQDLGWMIAKARSYMTHLVPTKHGDDMPELCRNYHRECAYWAWKGQCEQNPECKLHHTTK